MRKKFETCTLFFSVSTETAQKMRALGEEGWELKGIASGMGSVRAESVLIYQREIEPEEVSD